MGRRFSFFILAAVCFGLMGIAGLQAASDTEQNAEALEMIASRMKSLTQSLNGLPQPPAFDQKIQLPDNLLPPALKEQPVLEKDPEEKENDE